MHFLTGLLAFLVAIFIIILVHELGHFIVARLCGVKVRRLSIGFGKKLWSRIDKKGTEYVIALIPFGGYVKMLDARQEAVSPADLPYSFTQQSVIKRLAIILGGPLANFIFAFSLYWMIFSIGLTLPVPKIAEVIPHSIASRAGVQSPEIITQLQQREVYTWQDIIFTLFPYYGSNAQVDLKTDKGDYRLNLKDWHINPIQPQFIPSLGILPWHPPAQEPWPADLLHTEKYSPGYAWIPALAHSWRFTYFNLSILAKLFTGKLSFKILTGPIGLFKGVEYAAAYGFMSYTLLLAMLSITIGLINLLPIPALDGGQIMVILLETLFRKPISLAWQLLLYRLGLIVLFILIMQAIANDLQRF